MKTNGLGIRQFDLIRKKQAEGRVVITNLPRLVTGILGTLANGSVEYEYIELSQLTALEIAPLPARRLIVNFEDMDIHSDEIFAEEVEILGHCYIESYNIETYKYFSAEDAELTFTTRESSYKAKDKEVNDVTKQEINHIVNNPGLAKEFLETYRDMDDDTVAMIYNIPKKDVTKVIKGIISAYKIHGAI